MTKWGMFLRLLGCVGKNDLDWILHRVRGLDADKRNWKIRFTEEVRDQTWENEQHRLMLALRVDFTRTRLHRIHGWDIYTDFVDQKSGKIRVWLTCPNVDADIQMLIWGYDYDAFLKACNRAGGLNLDDLTWAMTHLTQMATEKGK